MAIRQIVKIGDEILKLKAKEVTEFDDRLALLLDDLKETMVSAQGVGIAAPQVGITKRVCIVCVDGNIVYELINPVLVKAGGTQCGLEGCLSVPGKHGYVERPKKLVVDAYDRTGKLKRYKVSDYEAVAFSHEMDHLDGIMFVDKIVEEPEIIKNKAKKAKSQ